MKRLRVLAVLVAVLCLDAEASHKGATKEQCKELGLTFVKGHKKANGQGLTSTYCRKKAPKKAKKGEANE